MLNVSERTKMLEEIMVCVDFKWVRQSKYRFLLSLFVVMSKLKKRIKIEQIISNLIINIDFTK